MRLAWSLAVPAADCGGTPDGFPADAPVGGGHLAAGIQDGTGEDLVGAVGQAAYADQIGACVSGELFAMA